MGDPRTCCVRCGVEILAATALRTGGICVPCKNGAPPEWARRRLWVKQGADPLGNTPWHRSPWGQEIIAICRALVSGEMECKEASRRLAELSQIVLDAAHGEKWLHEDWAVFFEVLPSGGRDSVADDHAERVRAAASKLLKQAGETAD